MSLDNIFTFSVPVDDLITKILQERGQSIGGLMTYIAQEAHSSLKKPFLKEEAVYVPTKTWKRNIQYKYTDANGEILWALEMHAAGKREAGLIYVGGNISTSDKSKYPSYDGEKKTSYDSTSEDRTKIPTQALATAVSAEFIKQTVPFTMGFLQYDQLFQKCEAYRKAFCISVQEANEQQR